ncbi:39S ribosomal protein L3, mitochondrial [Balamuthia mandrillaris]
MKGSLPLLAAMRGGPGAGAFAASSPVLWQQGMLRASSLSVIPLRKKKTKWRHNTIGVPKDQLFMERITPFDVFDRNTGWTQNSKRVGVVGVKVGMTSEWNEFYDFYPVTIIKLANCQVTQVKWTDKNRKPGEVMVQVGAGAVKPENLSKPLRMEFYRRGLEPKRHIAEFPVSENGVLPVGTEIRAEHFTPGQYLDISGVSIGKGFQGVMKRWGFAGQRASHGNSLSHRVPGSIGQHSIPSKVFKGKKLPGRMGGKNCTVKNLFLWKINTKHNLLYVRGHVPGHAGSFVRVSDAKNKWHYFPPPYPTYIRKKDETGEEEELPHIITANCKPPEWWSAMQARKAAFAEDPSKNKDDSLDVVSIVEAYRNSFPTVDKWRAGELPSGPWIYRDNSAFVSPGEISFTRAERDLLRFEVEGAEEERRAAELLSEWSAEALGMSELAEEEEEEDEGFYEEDEEEDEAEEDRK